MKVKSCFKNEPMKKAVEIKTLKNDFKQNCKICTKATNVIFNIEFRPVPICGWCVKAIIKQEVGSW